MLCWILLHNDKDPKEKVCGAETAGFKPTGFEPSPRQKMTARPAARSAANDNDGVLVPHPTTEAIMAGSSYQAGIHENCLATKLFLVIADLAVCVTNKNEICTCPQLHQKPAPH
jgi:hypothetical protein